MLKHQSMNLYQLSLLVALGLAFAGCSQDGFRGPTGTVGGKLTLEGKPISPGTIITFIASDGYIAAGQTGDDGEFDLLFKGSNQIPVAHYKVQVAPPPREEGAHFDMSASRRGAIAAVRPFPPKYGASSTSGLEVEVREGENLPLVIDLK
ncbi:hypothetical protein M4951_15890 [Blastopirellula sp. J2-11]|uniref:hypothetical protein n=1 Tax=Blastopirellula sp. J2-11 TaxID=2943192 RepID=UPI0021C6E80E|nr:hypothetical protein [Blastopirellula sp. J2-11]UUO04867.1 hypothetical protein M4951_15890 [Blastopirellula sp. J2-11]